MSKGSPRDAAAVPERSQIAGFAVLPGSTFLVNGARPDRDAAQIKIGGQLGITPASAIFASFDSELSGHAQFYGGKGGFKYVCQRRPHCLFQADGR